MLHYLRVCGLLRRLLFLTDMPRARNLWEMHETLSRFNVSHSFLHGAILLSGESRKSTNTQETNDKIGFFSRNDDSFRMIPGWILPKYFDASSKRSRDYYVFLILAENVARCNVRYRFYCERELIAYKRSNATLTYFKRYLSTVPLSSFTKAIHAARSFACISTETLQPEASPSFGASSAKEREILRVHL